MDEEELVDIPLEVKQLNRKIIDLIFERNLSPHLNILALISITTSYCKYVKLPDEYFRDLLQSILNEYRQD